MYDGIDPLLRRAAVYRTTTPNNPKVGRLGPSLLLARLLKFTHPDVITLDVERIKALVSADGGFSN